MALVVCHECKREVSSTSKTCPNCGAKVQLPRKPTSKRLLWLLGAVVIGTIGFGAMNGRERAEAQRNEEARFASLTPEQRGKELAQQAAQAQRTAADAAAVASKKEERDAGIKDIGLAEAACQMAAEKSANDPSSIEWIRDERQFAYSQSDRSKATSIQPMRAKNAAGGTIRTGVKCELTRTGATWTVKRMTEAR